jgi:hypothetical protein
MGTTNRQGANPPEADKVGETIWPKHLNPKIANRQGAKDAKVGEVIGGK